MIPDMSYAHASESAPVAAPRSGERLESLTRRAKRPELVGLVLLSAVLNLWALSRNGWANDYYSAAVRSMSTSWHDFLFASFDKAGLMTVDKPPLALWVQALSVRVFGFNSLAILVPQALMGVATVVLAYDLVRRRFGRFGGAVAGLALALTPISVAISRHNNPDALLVLCCVAALWFAVRGMEDGRTRWIVLAGVSVGLAFETKMLVALVVVPGIAAAWLWARPVAGRTLASLRALLWGALAALLVGGAWPALVELTPAGQRPWISGTSSNTIWSLIFEYNGLGRVNGQTGGPGGVGGTMFGGTPGVGCSTLPSEARMGGSWASPSSRLSRFSGRRACDAQTPEVRGWWRSAARSPPRRSSSPSHPGSSTPITSRFLRLSRPRSSAPAPRRCARAVVRCAGSPSRARCSA